MDFVPKHPEPEGSVACRIDRKRFQTDSTGRPPHEVLADWLIEHRKMNPNWQLKSIQEVEHHEHPGRHAYATYLIIWE